MADQESLKFNVTYPFSDEFDFETYIERINFDKDRVRKIKTGKAFIIDKPQGIKKDIKYKTGIFDKRYGSNSISDVDSFSTPFRCECGNLTGSIRKGEICPICKRPVKYVGEDILKNAYLVLNDNYWVIHPNLYRSLEAFIGVTRLSNIIEPEVNIGLDGMIVKKKKKVVKKDEIFAGIGILEFKERFEEVMNYYLKKYPHKKMYYDDIMDMYRKGYVFTHTISIYNSILRPCSVDDGTLKYEACNDQFNLMANLVYACNDDKLHIHRKKKNKLTLLYDIQTNLNDVYLEIKNILSKKKGC
jgi:hypothetical protein